MSETELRELDAEIHRKVLGRHCTFDMGNWWDHDGSGYGDESEAVPHYSTDIAAAWLVVERMLPILGHIYPQWDVGSGRLLHWCAVIESGSRRGVTAETAPLAICRAALQAVGATK